jgi:DNA-binding response OmpR family regulator
MATLLIVDNLSLDLTVEHLRAAFQPFGQVQSIRLIQDGSGRSLQFGYVEMPTPEMAEQARKALDGITLYGRTIRVAHAICGGSHTFYAGHRRIPPRLLLIDDDPVLLHAFPELIRLRLPGILTDTADSADLAVGLLSCFDYDAIISDLRMPGMDGLLLLRQAKELQPLTPVVIITGAGNEAVTRKAFEMGAFDVVWKPFDREEMRQSVRAAIQTYALRKQVVRLASTRRGSFKQRRLVHATPGLHPDGAKTILNSSDLIQRALPMIQGAIQRAHQILAEAEAHARRASWRRIQRLDRARN